ncbi:MAG: PEP-CTERM/exosortase system-associated acyltransferase [Methylococcales bacterium]|jgi:N-acyl amino acid synthase of PEP-CTERM/exosortase system|nr:PEP-CTERM/exosortase system-associated acyltransferase [Methylococcales bacterium]
MDSFDEYFEMVPACSDELKSQVYKLRYQVYCIENSFLNPEDYPDDMEFDDLDQRSVHYLIRHRKSGDYAATTRLILPDADNPGKLFPLEELCKIDDFALIKPIKREHLGEVSRFCVSKAFKKRKNEAHTLAGINADWQLDHFTENERRTFPHLSIALMACCIKASYENDIHYLYVVTEPAWTRFVSSLGIKLVQIGPLARGNYEGVRCPSVIKITDMLDSVAETSLDIWNLLTNSGQIKFTHY